MGHNEAASAGVRAADDSRVAELEGLATKFVAQPGTGRPVTAKDYVYTFWGTAWAVIGLSRDLRNEPIRG